MTSGSVIRSTSLPPFQDPTVHGPDKPEVRAYLGELQDPTRGGGHRAAGVVRGLRMKDGQVRPLAPDVVLEELGDQRPDVQGQRVKALLGRDVGDELVPADVLDDLLHPRGQRRLSAFAPSPPAYWGKRYVAPAGPGARTRATRLRSVCASVRVCRHTSLSLSHSLTIRPRGFGLQ